MRIAVRADASVQIGTGHVRRCATLARVLADRGAEIVLAIRRLDVDAAGMAAAAGFENRALPAPARAFEPRPGLPAHAHWAQVSWQEDADQTIAALRSFAPDLLVVDHYAFDAAWHVRVRVELGCRIVAIDDLGDRPLAADIIVDHNHAADYSAKHALSAPYAPRILGGPRFALLSERYRSRPDFTVRERIASIGIFMGGTDLVNATETAWGAVRAACGPELAVEIVSTSANPHLPALERIAAEDPRTGLIVDLPDLAGFFAAHDLQIGAGGGAVWERCCIGVPTITIAFADNHLPVLMPLDKEGVLCFSPQAAADPGRLASDLALLASDPERRRAISARARALVDGRGADRVGDAVHDLA